MDRVVILGAGLTGLSAAYALSNKGQSLTTVEREVTLGGLCRTFEFEGHHFDIGPHVIIPRSEEVTSLLTELCKDRMEKVGGRTEGIFYNNEFFENRLSMVLNLDLVSKVRAFSDLIFMRAFSRDPEVSCEDALVNHFGYYIYSKLLEGHSTKFWGIDASQIDAGWATIFGKPKPLLDQVKSVLHRKFTKTSSDKEPIKASSNAQGLMYLRGGIQTLCNALQKRISCSPHCSLLSNCEVVAVNHKSTTITSIEVNDKGTHTRRTLSGEEFISTIPIVELIRKLTPPPPSDILKLANSLYYRNLLVVNLIVDLVKPFPYAWAEIYSPDVTAGRITNFAEFSSNMAAGKSRAPLTLEYYCFEGDELWSMREDEILALAHADLKTMGLIDRGQACDGSVKKLREAYPMYVTGYQEVTAQLRDYTSQFDNLESIGRNGVFRYNNMGHSIESGLRAAEKVLGKEYDLWQLRVVDGTREDSAGTI
jgi:protoporphyrinogen oxidase